DSVTCVQGQEDGGPDGRQARDAGRPLDPLGRRRAQPAARQGCRARPEERHRRDQGDDVTAPKASVLGAQKKDVSLDEAVFGAEAFDAPSTHRAAKLLADWGQPTPTLVVATEDEGNLIRSFRNLDRVVVTVPSELEVTHVVWARSLLVSRAALDAVQGRAAKA